MIADYVIRYFEPGTSSFDERIEAAGKNAEAGYLLGFIIAPIVKYDGWQEGYWHLLEKLHARLSHVEVKYLTFELIQHRFTKTAKNTILKRYPKIKLNMDEEDQLKWGRYGKFKYVYKAETVEEIQQLFEKGTREYFPFAKIAYFV